jgi:hypothetical protein
MSPDISMTSAQVKLTSWPSSFSGMPFNSFTTTPTRSGQDFAVTGNFIRNCRGRGVYNRASSGLIAANTIQYLSYAGIIMTPDFYAKEGAFIKDVVVSGLGSIKDVLVSGLGVRVHRGRCGERLKVLGFIKNVVVRGCSWASRPSRAR